MADQREIDAAASQPSATSGRLPRKRTANGEFRDIKVDINDLKPLFSQDNFYALAEELTGYSKDELRTLHEITGNDLLGDSIEDEIEDDDEIKVVLPPVATGIPPSRPFDVPALIKSAANLKKRYRDALELNAVELGKEALREELKVYSALQNEFSQSLIELTAGRILGSANELVLRAILSGDIPKLYANDPPARAAFDRLRHTGSQQPVIYAQCFADSRGNSPTVSQWLRVMHEIKKYAAGNDYKNIVAMDSYKFASSTSSRIARQRIRRYLKGRSEKSVSKVVTKWANSFIKRIMQIPGTEWNKPLLPTLMEYGYTADVEQRLKNHRDHQSSNLLLNLAESALHVLHRGKYELQQFVVYHTWGPEQSVIAEMLFTRLGQGYAQDAAGFNAYPAGRSNASAYRINAETWKEIQRRALERSPYIPNIKHFEESYLARADEEMKLNRRLLEIEADWEKLKKDQEEHAKIQEVQEAEAHRLWAENWGPAQEAEVDEMVRNLGSILWALQPLLPPELRPPTDSPAEE